MKSIYLFLLIPCAILFASENYPQIFEQQGTPLFEAVHKFQKLKHIPVMEKAVERYVAEAGEALQFGKIADAAVEKKEKVAYLKVLRSLQKNYNKTISLVKKHLVDAMKQNDKDMFLTLVESDLDFGNSHLNEKMIVFYQQHSKVLHSESMDKRVLDQKAADTSAAEFAGDGMSHEDECNIGPLQHNLKNIINKPATFYAMVLVSGKDDWLQINDQYYSIIKDTQYTIACKYYEETGIARTYLFPLKKPFTIEAYITRLEAEKFAAMIFMRPDITAKYRQAASLKDTDLYLKKLTYVMQRHSKYIIAGPEIKPYVESSDELLSGP
ncbi:MAG: hypothetical protein ABFR02_01345 [Campylobacterota bacterium]